MKKEHNQSKVFLFVFVVAKSGEYISLEFTNMVTECSYDFVFVFDGPTYDSPLLGSFSGETIPDVLVATSQYVSLITNRDISSTILNLLSGNPERYSGGL